MNSQTKILLSVILLMLSLTASSQNKTLNFDILRNGNKVGRLVFTEMVSGGTDSLRSEYNVRTKLISTFVAEGNEMSVFKNGILKESSLYRQLDGKEKVNKKQRVENAKYIITAGTNSSELKDYPIAYDMLSLYTKEPVNIRKVYSTNFESTLDVEKIADHKYKIVFPDSYNYYFYSGGILNEMEIHHKVYSAKIVLSKK